MRREARGIAGIGLIAGLVLGVGVSNARAQAALADDAPANPETEIVAADTKTRFGVGLRLRQVVVPRAMIELFVERAESGVSNTGFGLELVRRKGNFEIVLGFEYESLSGKSGFWIDKGEMIPQNEPDYVEFDGFSWITGEIDFVWHSKLHDKVDLRYGAGLGLGVLRGDVLQTDGICTGSTVDTCTTQPGAQPVANDDIPPVFPVVNLQLGVQIKPTDKVRINIEGGMRTAFFVGTTLGVLF